MEGRCDHLLLMGWAVFMGFSLLSDFLWSGSTHQQNNGINTDTQTNLGTVPSEVYRGRYDLHKNGSLTQEGFLRVALASQQTSITGINTLTMSLALLEPHKHTSFMSTESDLVFSGIDFRDAGTLTATGATSPSRFSLFGSLSCRLDATVTFKSTSKASPPDAKAPKQHNAASQGSSQNPIAGEIVALDCGFSMTFAADPININYLAQKVVHYSVWVNVLTFVQIRCFLMQMRHTEEGMTAAKVSMVCIGLQALMDAYDSFLHLCLGLSAQYMFNTIAVICLFKFILFSLLEARYLLIIWRQRQQGAFNQGWEAARRELSWLYSRFYGLLIFGLIFIYNNMDHLDIIILCFQGYWVPQILYDAWLGTRRSALTSSFVIGVSVSRSLLILYLWGCPSGVFSGDLLPHLPGAPNPRLLIAVVFLQVAQVTVMVLQRSLGGRWFVPWLCLPRAYNYYRNVRIDGATECVICMSEIDPEDARRVITPCDHKFHKACLEQWMDVKMECPTCRAILPVMQ